MDKSYSIEHFGNTVELDFQSKADLKAIRQLEFTSRLLYGFVPDENNVWRPGKRSNSYIVGFPPGISWVCTSENRLSGTAVGGFEVDDAFLGELSKAIEGLCSGSTEDGPRYTFEIKTDSGVHAYEFHSRARTICALAVLYDLEWHPRKDLEIWVNFDYTDKLPPGETPDHSRPEQQYYGDPSKTADVLRNEGWAREALTPFMYVESRQVGRQSQQHYKITQVAQPIENQVKRTNIKSQWRLTLFTEQDFTCQICLSDYTESPEQLSPDHRIPVVFEPDNLTDANFMDKLMTLCRFCNQAKREFTKRLRFDYDWQSSPWAFPEQYRLEIVVNQIRTLIATGEMSEQEVLKQIQDKLASTVE